MSLIVQKFGGTSVADCEKILAAARKAIRAHQDGHQVVMVVSAMGKQTDQLIQLANQITDRPAAREMDMLLSTGEQVSVSLMAMAIHSLGYNAVSLTGAQIGIRTDAIHTKARIKSISTDRLRQLLDQGNIVIAAGFQGIDEHLDITTLGRGGSDTTAVALAAVLDADACEIYTDVDGVYTTDPRVLPEARQVDRISYDEMLELASLGASVMHNRSIEFAKKFGVPIHVRSSFSDAPGSMIVAESESDDRPVCGAAVTKNEARISVLGVPDRPGVSLQIFSRVAERNVTVDMIVQNVSEAGNADISFTVPRDELRITLEAVQEAIDSLGTGRITHDDNVSKVSVVGLGMANQTGVAEKMFAALAAEKINIQMISTSEIKISVLVERDAALPALRAVHAAFELAKKPATSSAVETGSRESADAADVASRLQGVDMEDLMLDDVTLDETQGRVTISGLPDIPGIAAHVFREVAASGIVVDMIVQSHDSHADHASLSFTVPRDQVASAAAVARRLADEFFCGGTSSEPEIAKLSVSGVGLRSNTGVAIRMFRALADAGVNVDMVNTSEVRVNVVADGKEGAAALASLKAAFADALR
ncbi:MAG: aspartate kinase [Pirellulaceae bacterium]|nr:aspartate kinase [Pirellulaceae bacterium]